MLGLLHNKEYVFHLKKGLREWPGLKAHEMALLAGIFSNGMETDVNLSSLQNAFYKNLPGIKGNIFDALMEHGYFHLPRPIARAATRHWCRIRRGRQSPAAPGIQPRRWW